MMFLCADISSLQLFPEFLCFCLCSKVEVPALPDEDDFPPLIQTPLSKQVLLCKGQLTQSQERKNEALRFLQMHESPLTQLWRGGKEEKYLLVAAREGSLPALPKVPAVRTSAAAAASPTGLQALVHTRQSKQRCDFKWV